MHFYSFFKQVFWLIVVWILDVISGQEHCHTIMSSSFPNDPYDISTNIHWFHTREVSFYAFIHIHPFKQVFWLIVIWI